MKLNIQESAKLLLHLADEFYQIGAEGQETTAEDNVTLECELTDIQHGTRTVRVVISEVWERECEE